jgi:hypothetical protein
MIFHFSSFSLISLAQNDGDDKDVKPEQNTSNELSSEQTPKQCFPIYTNGKITLKINE